MSTEVSTQGLELKQKIAELKEMLLSKNPQMPRLLEIIYKTCKQQPENVTLIEEDEIQAVVKGLEIQTSTFLAVSATKSTPSKTAALKDKINKLGADAF